MHYKPFTGLVFTVIIGQQLPSLSEMLSKGQPAESDSAVHMHSFPWKDSKGSKIVHTLSVTFSLNFRQDVSIWLLSTDTSNKWGLST